MIYQPKKTQLCFEIILMIFLFSFFLYYNYLKALSRLHQLKLLGHTLAVEFAKEQDSVQVLSQPSVSEKCKRYVHNNSVLTFVAKGKKCIVHDTFLVLLSKRIN